MLHGWGSDEVILALWRSGMNTRDIASATWQRESLVANRLPEILLRARQNDEWDRAERRN